MSHAIYQTPAMILQTSSMRESNKLAVLYTRDFGLIYVAAQSIREAKSKMKAHLHTCSLASVDLVRGRDIWRLTGIHEDLSSLSFAGTKWFALLDRYSSSLKRLCPGEEPNFDLWDDISELYEYIREDLSQPHKKIFSKEDVAIIEIVLMARSLNHLGYWSGDELPLTSKHIYSSEIIDYVSTHKSLMFKKINEGLRRSQL